MKRYRIIIALICAFLLTGCGIHSEDIGLDDFKWKLELVTDKSGAILASGSQKDIENKLTDNYKDISCICDANSNISITDSSDGKNWNGKYTLKMSDRDAKSYDLTFQEDFSVTGILGKRKYSNGESKYSFTIYKDDMIISFLADNE